MLNYIYVLHNISIKQHWFRVLVKEEITNQKINKQPQNNNLLWQWPGTEGQIQGSKRCYLILKKKKNSLGKIIKGNKNKSTSSGPGISDRVAISTPSTILVSNITALGEMAGAETIQDELQQLVIPETKVVKYTTWTYKRDSGADWKEYSVTKAGTIWAIKWITEHWIITQRIKNHESTLI